MVNAIEPLVDRRIKVDCSLPLFCEWVDQVNVWASEDCEVYFDEALSCDQRVLLINDKPFVYVDALWLMWLYRCSRHLDGYRDLERWAKRRFGAHAVTWYKNWKRKFPDNYKEIIRALSR